MAICASRYAIKTGNSLCSLLRHSEYKTALCKSGCDAHKTFETEKNDPIGFSFRTTTKTATDFREFRWGESNSARLLAPKYESNVNYIVNKTLNKLEPVSSSTIDYGRSRLQPGQSEPHKCRALAPGSTPEIRYETATRGLPCNPSLPSAEARHRTHR